MTELVYRALLVWAITFALRSATIFDSTIVTYSGKRVRGLGLRPLISSVGLLEAMLDCGYCTGFHVGWVVELAYGNTNLYALVRAGLVGAATSLLLETLWTALKGAHIDSPTGWDVEPTGETESNEEASGCGRN